ncbi:DadA Glycine/D-amino acid oxidases (deaminating) [Candidatus Methylopumilus universalis]|uniref:FAD-dependent 5-carboxymethylaminomethyl-2-thiouridine(34) oxidoreductase MnmC n=1 Tax=Candidatus Methylopumilus universalis TaxID=2588536 RepID=UPI003BEEBFBE
MQKNIVIIGAGITGCSLAHFLANTGWDVTLLESQDDIASGGSGNPVAAIYPKFMLNDKAYNDFMLKSFMFTTAWIDKLGLNKDDYRFDGAIEILEEAYSHKLEINLSDGSVDQEKILTLIDKPILKKYLMNQDLSGLLFHRGGWVNPIALCRHLVNHSNIKILTNQKIISIEKLNNEWTLKTKDQKIFKSDHVAICNAAYLHQFDLTQHLHTDAFRGQINWVNSTPFQMPSIVICDEGYVAPLMQNKHIFGATYGMNDFNKDLRLSDTKKNITSIKKIHREFHNYCLAQKTISGRVSWRASTKDRKPYVGRVFNNELFKKMRVRELAQTDQLPWLDNFYVASGFGSRGFTFAPYCTFVLANLINKKLSKDDKETLNYTNPERYRLKKMSLKKAASRIFKV